MMSARKGTLSSDISLRAGQQIALTTDTVFRPGQEEKLTQPNLDTPRLLTDEVKVFEIANGLVCRVRVRSFDLGNVVAVLFTQNRNPELYPEFEVVNRGRSITNMAEQLVFLAGNAW